MFSCFGSPAPGGARLVDRVHGVGIARLVRLEMVAKAVVRLDELLVLLNRDPEWNGLRLRHSNPNPFMSLMIAEPV